MRHAMMIELDKCIGCQACVTSCKERWDSGPGAARDWVMTFEHGNRDEGDLGVTFYPGLCNHCDDHPCTADCPTGATYMTAQGVVVVDPDVCIGCGNCVPACPYGARHADPVKGIVEKCNFCAPYVARGELPACVATCLAQCRHFGDLDDEQGELVQLIRARKAKPLVTNEIDVRPNIYYAPAEQRMQVLAQGVVRRYGSTLFTEAWQQVTRPLARWAVAPAVVVTGLAGIAINLRMRLAERHPHPAPAASPAVSAPGAASDATLPRHPLGMRFLHWFNLLSWILLLVTGTSLMATAGFALFGLSLPQAVASWYGGKASLIYFHAAWGVLWALIIVPLFIYYKRGGIEALHELWPSGDDLRWLLAKPLVMLGIWGHDRLPPQDKYNFGQKAFAITALVGTALIIVSGAVMTFHLGDASVVRSAILVHKLAILLALLGIAVHVTMAAILVEERPALWAMIMGQIDRRHAELHSAKWVAELERRRQLDRRHGDHSEGGV
ncbi:MAG: 4Fe-4S dicluster domain-containing protein [Pseudomonadota bacterium]